MKQVQAITSRVNICHDCVTLSSCCAVLHSADASCQFVFLSIKISKTVCRLAVYWIVKATFTPWRTHARREIKNEICLACFRKAYCMFKQSLDASRIILRRDTRWDDRIVSLLRQSNAIAHSKLRVHLINTNWSDVISKEHRLRAQILFSNFMNLPLHFSIVNCCLLLLL